MSAGLITVLVLILYLAGAGAAWLVWEAAEYTNSTRVAITWWSWPLVLLWPVLITVGGGIALLLLVYDAVAARRRRGPPPWRERRCPRCHTRYPEA